MKPIDHALDRLLRAAARAPQPGVGPLSMATQARAIAALRAHRDAAPSFALLRTWRVGMATACATAAVAIVAGLFASSRLDDSANDPYVLNDPGMAVAMTTGWLP